MQHEEEFLNLLIREIEENRLVLPTLPEVALRVRDEVESERGSASGVAEIIVTDPSLSARLIQVANSPLYRGRRQVEDIKTAVTRLGTALVRSLVTSLVMQQIFQATSEALDQRFRAIWEHTVQVAAISRVLAGQCPHLRPEQAMLGGLVHNIGALPILVLAEDTPELIQNQWILDQMVERLHPKVGKIILETWRFPDTLIDVVTQYQDFQRDPAPEADYADVVMTANLQSYLGTDHPYASMDWNEIPALRKLGLEADIQIVDIEGAAEEIDEVQQMLTG